MIFMKKRIKKTAHEVQFVNSQQQKNERVNKLVLMCFYYSTFLAVMEVFLRQERTNSC